jgi:hypothetical protein
MNPISEIHHLRCVRRVRILVGDGLSSIGGALRRPGMIQDQATTNVLLELLTLILRSAAPWRRKQRPSDDLETRTLPVKKTKPQNSGGLFNTRHRVHRVRMVRTARSRMARTGRNHPDKAPGENRRAYAGSSGSPGEFSFSAVAIYSNP